MFLERFGQGQPVAFFVPSRKKPLQVRWSEVCERGIFRQQSSELERKLERTGLAEEEEQTIFIPSSQFAPTVHQFGIVFHPFVDLTVKFGCFPRKKFHRLCPKFESLVDVAGLGPEQALLHPEVGPVGKERSGRGEVPECFRFYGNGEFDGSARLVDAPIQRRQAYGASSGLKRHRVILLLPRRPHPFL